MDSSCKLYRYLYTCIVPLRYCPLYILGGTRIEKMGYQTSPHAQNIPENNICTLVKYRRVEVG